MSRDPFSVLAQGNRAAVVLKLAEHDTALDTHDAAIAALQEGAPTGFAAFNDDAVSLVPGMPIAAGIHTGGVRRGDASSIATASILGLVIAGAAPTLGVQVQPDGALSLPTSSWDAVTGGSGGLIAGARYYLDASPGRITTTPPTAPGTSVTPLGRALSATVIVLHIMPYVYQ